MVQLLLRNLLKQFKKSKPLSSSTHAGMPIYNTLHKQHQTMKQTITNKYVTFKKSFDLCWVLQSIQRTGEYQYYFVLNMIMSLCFYDSLFAMELLFARSKNVIKEIRKERQRIHNSKLYNQRQSPQFKQWWQIIEIESLEIKRHDLSYRGERKLQRGNTEKTEMCSQQSVIRF